MALLPNPDSKWPFHEPPGGPLDLNQEVVAPAHELLELRARQQYDVLKPDLQARAERLDRYAGAELQALLPDIAALQLKPGTARRYRTEFAAFKKFCSEYHPFDGEPLPALPAAASQVCLYLLQRHIQGASYGRLRLISAAISDAHHLHHFADPCSDILVKAALAYSRRNRGQFSKRQRQEASDEKTSA